MLHLPFVYPSERTTVTTQRLFQRWLTLLCSRRFISSQSGSEAVKPMLNERPSSACQAMWSVGASDFCIVHFCVRPKAADQSRDYPFTV